jgi:hypothetical protein
MLGTGSLFNRRREHLSVLVLLLSFSFMNCAVASDQKPSPRIYLANPLGFSEAGQKFIR